MSSLCIIFSLFSCSVLHLHDQSSLFSVQAPGLKSVRPLKNIGVPRAGALASELREPRGKEQAGRREARCREGRKRASFSGPFPSSQILIGPPRALLPRSSGAERTHGDLPCNWGIALSIRSGTRRRILPSLCAQFDSKTQKRAIIREQNPLK